MAAALPSVAPVQSMLTATRCAHVFYRSRRLALALSQQFKAAVQPKPAPRCKRHGSVSKGFNLATARPGGAILPRALFPGNARPDDADINAAMAGNICRCGTYVRIRDAIKSAAGDGSRRPS